MKLKPMSYDIMKEVIEWYQPQYDIHSLNSLFINLRDLTEKASRLNDDVLQIWLYKMCIEQPNASLWNLKDYVGLYKEYYSKAPIEVLNKIYLHPQRSTDDIRYLADAYVRDHNNARAIQLYAKASKQPDGTIEDLRKAAESAMCSHNVELMILWHKRVYEHPDHKTRDIKALALAYEISSNYKEALKYYTEAADEFNIAHCMKKLALSIDSKK